jgi:hypothetical protein
VLPDNCLVNPGLEEYDSSVAWQVCRNASAAFEDAKLRRRSDLQMQHRREPVSMRPVRCLASPDHCWTQTQIYPMSLLGYPHSSSRNGTPTALIWTITEKSRHGPGHQNEPARIPALEQPRYVVHCIHRLQHFHCFYTCIELCSPPSFALFLLLVLRISLRGNTWTLSTPHSPEPHIFHLEPGNRFATNTEKLHHPLGDHSIISIYHTHTLGSEIMARIGMSPFPIFRDQLGCKRLKYGN